MSRLRLTRKTLITGALGVFVIVGLGVWLLPNHETVEQKTASQVNQKAKTRSDSSSSQATKRPASVQVSLQDNYLIIDDWKVRFVIPENLRKDLLFFVDTSGSDETIRFASKKLNSLTGDESCDLIKQPNGSYNSGLQATLIRINSSGLEPDALNYYSRLYDYIKTIDGFNYYHSKPAKNPPITCLTGRHEELQSVEQSISDELKKAFEQTESL
jgi:hypothetical protein